MKLKAFFVICEFQRVCRSREGKALEESDRVKMSSSLSDGVYTLRVSGLTEDDSGQYTIKAVNDAGQTSCTATLLVHGQFNTDTPPISCYCSCRSSSSSIT